MCITKTNMYGKTNIFCITDETEYNCLCSNFSSCITDIVQVYNNRRYHSLWILLPVEYIRDAEDLFSLKTIYPVFAFILDLQEILPDGETFVYEEYDNTNNVSLLIYATNKDCDVFSL